MERARTPHAAVLRRSTKGNDRKGSARSAQCGRRGAGSRAGRRRRRERRRIQAGFSAARPPSAPTRHRSENRDCRPTANAASRGSPPWWLCNVAGEDLRPAAAKEAQPVFPWDCPAAFPENPDGNKEAKRVCASENPAVRDVAAEPLNRKYNVNPDGQLLYFPVTLPASLST